MIKCNIDFISLARVILSNTGRGPLHRGHYQECLQNPQMKYSLIQFAMNDDDLNANMGLCLPRVCPDKAIQSSINSALKILGTDLNIYWIKSDTQHYQFPLFWVSYLTIFLIVTLIILAFVATVKGYKSKQNKYLNSFNIVSNMKHFEIREGEDLNAWDGVRSLAMMWVVIGHTFSFSLNVIDNITSITYFGNQAYILVLEAGILAVDVFFCLGGFFLAFIMLRNKITPKICGLGILQRALRVWPAFILSMLFFYSLYMRLGYGPNWSFQQYYCLRCSSMWQQILFISNFTNIIAGQMCMGWIWYLQVDFQLFVIGVFLLYLYSINKGAMYITNIVMSLLSSIFIFVYVQINEYFVTADISEQSSDVNFTYYIYNSPYGRCVPYLMGLALGVMYMEYRKEIKDKKEEKVTILGRVRKMFEQRKFLRITIQWVGIGLMTLVTFIVRPLQTGSHWPQEAHSLYLVLSKPVFIFGMMLTVLPSILGINHSFFSHILNAKLFAWIARISFCTYLVHLMVILGYYYSRTYDVYYKVQDTFATYMGLLTLSLFFGFIMTMLVELPFANLLKLLMTGFTTKGRGVAEVQEQKCRSLLTTESIVKQGRQPIS